MPVFFSFDRFRPRQLAVTLAAALCLGPASLCLGPGGARAQPPEGVEIGSLFPTQRNAESSDPSADSLPIDSVPEDQPITQWLDNLGAGEFAARERAATRLLEIGPAVLPMLRQLERTTDDPEVRLRARELARQLRRGDFEARIKAFLAGDQVGFEGWEVARSILGDSPSIRNLFVQMLRSHPQLVASLTGPPRGRASAMEGVMVKVQRGMLFQRRLPNAADAFALLLPANDPNVPMSQPYQDAVLSVLRKSVVNQLHNDPQLSDPFRALVGGWVRRTSLQLRQDVLVFALNWEISEALSLAIQTLSETEEIDTLAFALQTIAQFGDEQDAGAVVPLLDDARPTSQRAFASGEVLQTQLGDVAMATIAVLHDVSLVAAGFPQAAKHEKYGFVVEDVGFPAGDDQAREAAREKIDRILAGEQIGDL